MLHLKYRPTRLDEVVGNRGIKQSLAKLLENKKNFPHTFLFTGEAGCGKTTFGRILAREIGCIESEIRELNASDTRGIDFARSIISDCRMMPLHGKVKVFILDEVHMLTTEAMNSLLKVLEDTPPHVYFILCTTDPNKLLSTIKTRCYQYTVSKLVHSDLHNLLARVALNEKLEVSPQVLDVIVEVSDGIPRNALVLLGMLQGVTDIDEALDIAYRELYNADNIREFAKLILQESGTHIEGVSYPDWKGIVGIYNKSYKQEDPEKLRIALFAYFGGWLKNEHNPKIIRIMEKLRPPLTAPYAQDFLLRIATICQR